MVDPSKFVRLNVADTCSIWNVLASRILYSAARAAQVSLCVTHFVRYECLNKPGQIRPERSELQRRLQREIDLGGVTCCNIDLEDLQDIEVLQARGRISKGELSSMVFARKTQQAFMTDDRKAAKLADEILPSHRVQSTPHLFAWLYFAGGLQDSDKGAIAADLLALGRNLQPHLDAAYNEALRCRLASQASAILSGHVSVGSPQGVQKGMSSSVIGETQGSGITNASSGKPS
jgi:hypothetical protein